MLTEAKLLTMPEKDYMNEAQLEFFSKLLTDQRAEVAENIAASKQNLQALEHNADPVDVASLQEQQQIELRTVERQTKLVRKIDQALDRIKSGDYGYCVETDEPIGIRRLLARPTATLSIQAKEVQEHYERTEGSGRREDDE